MNVLEVVKNKKAPGTDNVEVELIKQTLLSLLQRLLFNICLEYGHIQEEWKIAITTPTFKEIC
jgi:hypothetical protein